MESTLTPNCEEMNSDLISPEDLCGPVKPDVAVSSSSIDSEYTVYIIEQTPDICAENNVNKDEGIKLKPLGSEENNVNKNESIKLNPLGSEENIVNQNEGIKLNPSGSEKNNVNKNEAIKLNPLDSEEKNVNKNEGIYLNLSDSDANPFENNTTDKMRNKNILYGFNLENKNVEMIVINEDQSNSTDVDMEIINELDPNPSSTTNSTEITSNPASVATYFTEESMNEDTVETNSVSSLANMSTSSKTANTFSTDQLNYEQQKNEFKETIDHVFLAPLPYKRSKIDIFTNDTGPKWYDVHGNVVTLPIVPKKVVKAFEHLPVHGRANSKEELEEFQNNKIREFVGCDLSEEDFDKLAKYCSPKLLETGEELKLPHNLPTPGVTPAAKVDRNKVSKKEDNELCVVKKCRMRQINNSTNQAIVRLKYRSLRLMPFNLEDDITADTDPDLLLVPGKDLLYHIRVYRPFIYNQKENSSRGRTCVVSRTLVCCGRLPVWALRDRLLCPNDLDIRLDVSHDPSGTPSTCAREVFPSAFMFINNVFYVDTRDQCHDISAPVRAFATARRLIEFPKRDMNVTLDEISIRLGHPEVYVHQGNCEHLFTFSEVRLVNASDPLRLTSYPYVRGLSQNHTVYCTTCAEFAAKWIVTGCRRVPFQPAFFCETCFKQYLYTKDNSKVDDFKAYSYMGNELNVLKSL